MLSGFLKGRWRVIMRKVDVYLKQIVVIVATCIVLQENMYK